MDTSSSSETNNIPKVSGSGDLSGAVTPELNATETMTTAHDQQPPPPAHPSLHRANTNTTLSSGVEGLILFDLTNEPGGTTAFSPHCTKTVLDLKLLGVGYERQRLSFVQIRTDLAARVAENVTVPTLELSDGTHLTESWAIAEYLERKHPQGHKIFGNSSGKRLAAMLNDFGKTILAPNLGPLAMPRLASLLDEESKSYFINQKVGKARFDKISNSTDRDLMVEQAKSKLQVVQAALQADPAADQAQTQLSGSRRERSPWIAGGEEPNHADFVLFGWYVYTRAAGPAVAKEIWHHHAAVKRWTLAMLDWAGPEITKDLVN